MKFSAVAFDLDGTLYPNSRFFVRLVPFILKEQRFLRAFGRARTMLRQNAEPVSGDLYDKQAGIVGEILGIPAEEAKMRIEKYIYRGWEPVFSEIKLYPHLKETLDSFRNAGIKLGLLSDFPPQAKLKNLSISEYWYTHFSSEETGHLKPHPVPFIELARRMGKSPEEILYVGNSIPYDVQGAHGVGMKTALIRPGWKKRPPKNIPCFVFYDYRQLLDYVLN